MIEQPFCSRVNYTISQCRRLSDLPWRDLPGVLSRLGFSVLHNCFHLSVLTLSIALAQPHAAFVSAVCARQARIRCVRDTGLHRLSLVLPESDPGQVKHWSDIPWYALLAGLFGVMVIAAVSYMIPQIGVAGSTITVVTGQLLIGAMLDHFGWWGVIQRPVEPARLPGMGIVLLGVWLTVR